MNINIIIRVRKFKFYNLQKDCRDGNLFYNNRKMPYTRQPYTYYKNYKINNLKYQLLF